MPLSHAFQILPSPKPGTIRFRVNLDALPTPPETLFANACAVIDRGLFFEFAFLDNRRTEESRLVISVLTDIDSVVTHLWLTSRQFHETDRELFQKAKIDIPRVHTSAPTSDEAPVVMSNVFRLARASVHAVFECYYLSPTELYRATTKGTNPEVEAVIRIQLPAPVLIGLLDFVATKIDDLKARLGPLGSGGEVVQP
jgi:hypothetical protein